MNDLARRACTCSTRLCHIVGTVNNLFHSAIMFTLCNPFRLSDNSLKWCVLAPICKIMNDDVETKFTDSAENVSLTFELVASNLAFWRFLEYFTALSSILVAFGLYSH